MKLRKLVLLSSLVLSALAAACGGAPPGEVEATTAAPAAASTVSTYGRLRVCGVHLCSASGAQVQLRGMSLFWSNTGWGGERFYNASAISNLANGWGATVVRAAIGVEGQGGYLSSSTAAQANLNRAITVIDAAIASGIYVIVDWHYSSSVVYQSQAQAFFQQLARRYASSPNVIWEPYSEPTTNPWSSLKAYHQAIISTIRAAGSQNLVVVGTPNWSQDVDVAALDKLSDPNVAYTLHFYAGTHSQSLRNKGSLAMSRGAALFVTEWGTCGASGNGNYDSTESTKWTSWMDTSGISSANWSLNDKVETASALVAGASATGPWSSGDLTQSGLFAKSYVMRLVGGPTYGITVTNVGQNGGAGTVTNAGNQISCGTSCFYRYPSGWVTTLTATPSASSTFAGWGGACSGTAPTCAVTLDREQSVTATFVGVGFTIPFTVSKAGSGTGTVTSTPGGIDCGSTCTASFPLDSVVTLTAKATAPSVFTGWTGWCGGTDPICVLTLGEAKSATASFGPAGLYELTVGKAGTGAGTVTSTPAGIDCGSICAANFPADSLVTLTAIATYPSAFAGWGGSYACGDDEPICVLPLSQAGDTVAYFYAAEDLTFHVSMDGLGSGTITSDVGGIDCPDTCSANLPVGTPVTLTATPAAGSSFGAWSGECSGTSPTCVIVTGEYGLQVNATFDIPGVYALTASTAGNGMGKITSTPAGIDCGTICTAGFPAGGVVTLTATPIDMVGWRSTFTGWSGACTGTQPTCEVTIEQKTAVAASFSSTWTTYGVNVTKTGSGAGTVTGSGSHGVISCGSICSTSIPVDGVLTLTATAQAGSVFTGWGGDCAGTAATCTLKITRSAAVTATFTTDLVPTGGCKVTYEPTSQWSGGFGATLVIQNTGTAAWTSWTVTWTYPNASQKITQIWNATVSQSGQAVTVKNVSYNGAIPAGGSYSSVGFNGTWSGSNPAPTGFSVNGIPCN